MDRLSRAVMDTVHLGIGYALDPGADPDIQTYRPAVTGLRLGEIRFHRTSLLSSFGLEMAGFGRHLFGSCHLLEVR